MVPVLGACKDPCSAAGTTSFLISIYFYIIKICSNLKTTTLKKYVKDNDELVILEAKLDTIDHRTFALNIVASICGRNVSKLLFFQPPLPSSEDGLTKLSEKIALDDMEATKTMWSKTILDDSNNYVPPTLMEARFPGSTPHPAKDEMLRFKIDERKHSQVVETKNINESDTASTSKKAKYKHSDTTDVRFLGWEVNEAELGIVDTENTTNWSWPPTDEVCRLLGVGIASDRIWYAMHGLKAPVEWKVQAAGRMDYSPQWKSPDDPHMDGACHTVTDCWLLEVLEKIEKYIILDPNTWFKHGSPRQGRKKDQLIKVYGGAYVLGQQEGDLKLIWGFRHSEGIFHYIELATQTLPQTRYTVLQKLQNSVSGKISFMHLLTWRT